MIAAAAAELSVVVAAEPDPVAQGQQLQYALVVTNSGSLQATGVVLSDTLPTEVAFVSTQTSQGSCVESGGLVVCDLGALGNGAQATVKITATLVAPPGEGEELRNEAVVHSEQHDLASWNNVYVGYTDYGESEARRVYLPLVVRSSSSP